MNKNCTKFENHTKIKVEENKRKAIFLNYSRDEYAISKIDDCVVTSGMRTDFLVSKVSETSILIELKGKDVAHACEQLFTSARHASVTPLLEEKIGFLVVCSKWPRFDSFVAKAKTRAAREFKAGFHVICDKGEFDINRVSAIDGPR